MSELIVRDTEEMKKSRYGTVQYIGEKVPFRTVGYDGAAAPGLPPDPEGNGFYEFTDEKFVFAIRTKMDMDYFLNQPKTYIVQEKGLDRPKRPRPKAQDLEQLEKEPKVKLKPRSDGISKSYIDGFSDVSKSAKQVNPTDKPDKPEKRKSHMSKLWEEVRAKGFRTPADMKKASKLDIHSGADYKKYLEEENAKEVKKEAVESLNAA